MHVRILHHVMMHIHVDACSLCRMDTVSIYCKSGIQSKSISREGTVCTMRTVWRYMYNIVCMVLCKDGDLFLCNLLIVGCALTPLPGRYLGAFV